MDTDPYVLCSQPRQGIYWFPSAVEFTPPKCQFHIYYICRVLFYFPCSMSTGISQRFREPPYLASVCVSLWPCELETTLNEFYVSL
eukprot:m.334 g.334  ORF g.334 m.334 type:complete len:86 (+) comp1734_c0_seq2:356-613(+)